jgi:ubiquinone/menaquinone biosynthesis C-methylase UbiE
VSDHVEHNRRYWDGQAAEYGTWAPRAWEQAEVTWGMWNVPDAELQMLPEDMTGMRAIELGCGTAYMSAYMARRGAEVVGIDLSPNQLATATRLRDEHGLDIDLRLGDAEELPFPDETFDFALSEYGAAIWCDPDRWIPEAWRVLRPGVCLTLEDWFAMFRRVGFTVEDYREPHPKDASAGLKYSVDAAWASRWPSEQIFKLRKR